MEFVVGGFLAAVTIVVAVVGNSVHNRRKTLGEVIRRVGEGLGLKYRQGFSLAMPVASGNIDGLKVTVRRFSDPQNRSGVSTLLRIYIANSINAGGILKMTLESDALFSTVEKLLKGDDIQIGDGAFDGRMLIKGTSPHHVAALMNERVRALLLGIAGRTHGLNLTSNWFEVVLDYEGKTKDDIVSIGRDALEVSRDLARGDDVRSRLMEIIRSDSVPGVRAACIRHLASHFPVNGDMTALLKRALKDDSRFVRIEAALNLGYEGLEFLAQLLNKESDLEEYDTLRIIRHFGEHRFAGGIPVLKEVFVRANNETVLLEILKAFIAMGDTGLNGFLLERLGGSSGDIRYWLISALASCGTAEAVEPLMKLAKSSLNPLLRSDVQRAIAGIQSRLGGADAGWLSVSALEGTEGALSMGDTAGEGSLSVHGGDRVSKKKNNKDR